jgi:folate-binding protein YgfZ
MIIKIKNRKVIKIEGPDRHKFIQGLITNDINKLEKNSALYTAFLSPQGKFLFDFFIYETGEALLLTPEDKQTDTLVKKLKVYKLRSNVSIDSIDSWHVYADLNTQHNVSDTISFVDPRNEKMGTILLSSKTIKENGTMNDYDSKRISLCIPDGSRDMPIDKAIILENGLDDLNAIDWKKGCYLGQELISRTKHRGLIRKKLIRVQFENSSPQNGELLFLDGTKAGVMRSSCHNKGLALIRIEHMEKLKEEGVFLTSESNIKVFLIN